MKRFNKRIAFVLSLIAIMTAACIHLVFAVDGVSMPDLTQDTSNLTVTVQYTDEKVSTPIKGMELTVYKVADVKVSGGVATYTATKDFESAGIDFNNMTTDSSITAAAALEELAAGKTGTKATSDGSGSASFGAVSNGIYLVVQSGAIGDAKDYTRLKPYLVMAPMPLVDIGQNAWEYDVVSIPKMEVINKIIKITKKVNAGDSAAIERRTDVFSYDILAEVGYEPDQFAVVDHVPDPLEIVDQHLIEVQMNGQVMSDAELAKMLKVEGNTLRVEMTKEQLKQYAPFEMSVLFYCRFRSDIELTEENVDVVNRAGYEVDGEYVEPPGDDHEARVRGVVEKPKETETIVKRVVRAVQTGDTNIIAIWIGVLVAAIAVVAVLLVRRRRRSD